jgi:predicted MPP superfamily phosphohydrolase
VRVKLWPLLGIVLMQIFLLLAHGFVCHSWIVLLGSHLPVSAWALRTAMIVLALSFIPATLLAFRMDNGVVRAFYVAAASWLGFFNFFFWAVCVAWIFSAFVGPEAAARICGGLTAAAFLVGVYGLVNARWIRQRAYLVRLPHLPESWRGRRAVLLSDVHLGPINGLGFSRRLARKIAALEPEIVFLPGDLFDGGAVDGERLLAPWRALRVPLGIYFSTGNHDEFGELSAYRRAIESAGIRVLHNESVEVDGVAVLGVAYADSTSPLHLQHALERMRPGADQAAILLNHVPHRLPVVAGSGIHLQLSGHTHGGQIAPFTWLTRRVFGRFTSGLQRFGTMTVCTSTGVGVWGPPMRVGSASEIVMLRFEPEESE